MKTLGCASSAPRTTKCLNGKWSSRITLERYAVTVSLKSSILRALGLGDNLPLSDFDLLAVVGVGVDPLETVERTD